MELSSNNMKHLRSTLLHVRQRELGHGKHLENVAAECALHVVKVDLGKVIAHDLLRCVVDQHMDDTVFVDVLLHGLLALGVVHQVAGDEKTLTALLLDQGFGLLGVFLLLGEIHDCDVGALAREEDGDRAANSGTEPVSMADKSWERDAGRTLRL